MPRAPLSRAARLARQPALPARLGADPEHAYSYYSQSLPVFDRNLQKLAQKIRPSCVLAHIKPEFLAQIHGTTDSEWIYALLVSQFSGSLEKLEEKTTFNAIRNTLQIIRDARPHVAVRLLD